MRDGLVSKEELEEILDQQQDTRQQRISGRRLGEMRGLDRLYARSTREMARVLRPDGRCVLLTGEPNVLFRALPPALRFVSKRLILLRGLPVTAFVMVRA